MKIKKGFAKREIAGSHIVVPVGSKAKEFNGMITLNESGAFFWDCFTKDITMDEAVALVTDEYDIDAATAKKDIENFINMLNENNLMDM
ncbi:MAG: PqqD family protein [Clostridium sp.]|nr:PqqD family protein [Clostridium sp.]